MRADVRSRARSLPALICTCLLAALLVAATPALGNDTPEQTTARTIDDTFESVSRDFPGFAGVEVDRESNRVRIFTAPNAARNGRAIVARIARLLDYPELVDYSPVLVDVVYSFQELHRAYISLSRRALELDGVVFTDIDEGANSIAVAVSSSEARNRVEKLARDADIPAKMLIVLDAEPVVYESSLRDLHRPLVGGLQLGTTQFTCSLGFVARQNDVDHIVTNSHCTDVQGGAEGTIFGQPSIATPIGTEFRDPPLTTGGGCPAGRRCRFSDAALIRTNLLTTVDRGHVAVPETGLPQWGGLTYRLTRDRAPIGGDPVVKVGRTTGRTFGVIDRTCTDVNVSGTNITLRCQSQADYDSSPGDSGGPVITPFSGADSELRGIHWGSNGWFSPIGQIETELGHIGNCVPGSAC